MVGPAKPWRPWAGLRWTARTKRVEPGAANGGQACHRRAGSQMRERRADAARRLRQPAVGWSCRRLASRCGRHGKRDGTIAVPTHPSPGPAPSLRGSRLRAPLTPTNRRPGVSPPLRSRTGSLGRRPPQAGRIERLISAVIAYARSPRTRSARASPPLPENAPAPLSHALAATGDIRRWLDATSWQLPSPIHPADATPHFALHDTFAHSVRHRTVNRTGPFRQRASPITKRHIGRRTLCQPATHNRQNFMTAGTLYC